MEGVSRRACLKRRWMGGRPDSTNNDIVGVALKTPRIHWAAECHTALKGRRPTPREGKAEASQRRGQRVRLAS